MPPQQPKVADVLPFSVWQVESAQFVRRGLPERHYVCWADGIRFNGAWTTGGCAAWYRCRDRVHV